jgi:hypothetical protein
MTRLFDSSYHPVFGSLTWDDRRKQWSTQYRLQSGEQLDVVVDPGDEDRVAFLDQAAPYFTWALENERRILHEAITSHLLDLYNNGWREEEDPVLSAEEFTACLHWDLLKIGTIVPVEFGYDPAEMFGGHGIMVKVDAQLQYRGASLI